MGGLRVRLVGFALVLGCGSGTSQGEPTDTDPTTDAGMTPTGEGETGDGTGDETGTPLDPEDADQVGRMGARRLSRHEFDNTLEVLIGDDTRPGEALLPEDTLAPFDNDATTQRASMAYVEAAEVVGREAAQRLVADLQRRAAVVVCSPTGPEDAACMTEFVAGFGRRAIRRALTDVEIEEFTTLGLEIAAEADDFWAGVEVVISAVLLHPEFLYRIERGTPVDGEPGVFELDGYEVATRLSYLVLGTTTPDWLLDEAEAGALDSPAGVRGAAEDLLAQSEARTQVDRFHGQWLGYAYAPLPASLAASMRAETRTLIEDVVFDDPRSWLEAFTAPGTWIDDALATHYGLAPPGSDTPTWVDYGDSGRAGLLSHASFLAVGGGGEETNVVRRGLMIRTRLMCQDIPPPPPDLNIDEVPTIENACKEEVYAQQRSMGSCAGCHSQMDPIGFGLEAYDYAGLHRTHDPAMPSCEIEGNGDIAGVGTFSGPAELAQLLIDEDVLAGCATRQLYRYAMGRREDDAGAALVDDLLITLEEADHRFDALILALVGHPAFRFRREEEELPND